MALTWDLDSAAQLVRVRYTPPYTFEEWRAMIEDFSMRQGFPFQRHIGILVDWTEGGIPSPEFLERIASYVATHSVMLRGRRIAILVRDEKAIFAGWRQAERYEELGAVSTVFRSRLEAETWLRDPKSHDIL
jgi:hypothetical protein